MKLRLTHSLLSALLAAFSLPAAAVETVDLNGDLTHWEFGEGQYAFEDVNLSLDRDFLYEPPDDESYPGYLHIAWNADRHDSQASYTLTGNGVIGSSSGSAHISISGGGGEADPEVDDLDVFMCGYARYDIGSGISLKNVQLSAVYGAQVVFNGSISPETSPDTPCMFEVYTPSGTGRYVSRMDLSQADIGDQDYVLLEFGGGTIVRSQYEVSSCHGLELWSCGKDTQNTLEGSLTLSAGAQVWLYADAGSHPDPTQAPYGDAALTITGSLTIAGAATVIFEDAYNPDGEGLADGTPVFYCSSLSGDLGRLTVASSYWQEGEMDDATGIEITPGYNVIVPMEGYKLVSVAMDGCYGVLLQSPGGTVEPPAGEVEVITGGTVEGELSADRVVKLEDGGVADVTGVTPGSLSNLYISGTGGTLVTAEGQSFLLSGGATIGFSVTGADGSSYGAILVVGKIENSSLSDASVTLSGDLYASPAAFVYSGLLQIAKGAELGTADLLSDVHIGDQAVALSEGDAGSGSGTRDVTASLNNFGAINGDVYIHPQGSLANAADAQITGDVSIEKDGILANNGVILGRTTVSDGGSAWGTGWFSETEVQSGGLLRAGGSGIQSHGSLTLQQGSSLAFAIGGGTQTGPLIHVGSLVLNGSPSITLGITADVVSRGGSPFDVVLLQADETEGDGRLDENISINGADELLEYMNVWTDENGALIFSGKVDENALAAMLSEDAAQIANTLWASAASVRDFIRTANSQLLIGEPGRTTFWGAGTGTFINQTGRAGFIYDGGGYALGAQRAITQRWRSGLAIGQSFGRFRSNDHMAKVHQRGVMVGADAQYVAPVSQSQYMGLGAYAAYGRFENDADTHIGGIASLPGSVEWDDEAIAFGLRADWRMQISENSSLAIYTGMDYMHGAQESAVERYEGGERRYRDGNMQIWSVPVGLTLRTETSLGGAWKLAPEITVAYIGDIARNDPKTTVCINGKERGVKGASPARSAFQLNVGANLLLGRQWSVGAFYTLEARSGQTSQNANLSVRYTF